MSTREQQILDAIKAADSLRGAVLEAEFVCDRIEGARRQLSSTSDELRGQVTNIKDRVAWAIREIDHLRAQFVQLQKVQ